MQKCFENSFKTIFVASFLHQTFLERYEILFQFSDDCRVEWLHTAVSLGNCAPVRRQKTKKYYFDDRGWDGFNPNIGWALCE